LHSDEYVRLFRIGIAVIEFSDAATAENLAEAAEATRLFWDLGSDQHLGLITYSSAFRDVPQAIEVDVRAATNSDQCLAAQLVIRNIFFCASDSETASRFYNGSSVFENIADRCAALVGIDRDDLIDELLAESKRFVADTANGDTIRKYANMFKRYGFTSGEGVTHRRGVIGFNADNANIRLLEFYTGRDSCNQPTAANRYKYGVDVTAGLIKDFHADRALASDNGRIVERVYET
jgi:hypothetical protein